MYIQEIIFLIAFIDIQETSYGSSFPFPLSLLKYEYKLTYMYEHVLFIIYYFALVVFITELWIVSALTIFHSIKYIFI